MRREYEDVVRMFPTHINPYQKCRSTVAYNRIVEVQVDRPITELQNISYRI